MFKKIINKIFGFGGDELPKICPNCGERNFIRGHCHSCGYDTTW